MAFKTMTPEEHKSYEEAAKAYAALLPHQEALHIEAAELDFVAGAKFAHKLREDTEREAHNKALDEVYELFKRGQITHDSLQNLRK